MNRSLPTFKIPLSRGMFAIVDESDFEELSKHTWFYAHGYAVRNVRVRPGRGGQRLLGMHRFLMNTPDGYETDHVNGDKLDNRRSNLRIATKSQNMMNREYYRSASGYKGVYLIPNCTKPKKWRSYIMVNKKSICVGYFRTKTEAITAHREAIKRYHGEFAR